MRNGGAKWSQMNECLTKSPQWGKSESHFLPSLETRTRKVSHNGCHKTTDDYTWIGRRPQGASKTKMICVCTRGSRTSVTPVSCKKGVCPEYKNLTATLAPDPLGRIGQGCGGCVGSVERDPQVKTRTSTVGVGALCMTTGMENCTPDKKAGMTCSVAPAFLPQVILPRRTAASDMNWEIVCSFP